jgi:protein involved in polysaccharide export with SLBB domain
MKLVRQCLKKQIPAMIVLAGLPFCLNGCGQPSVSSREQIKKFDRLGEIRHFDGSEEQAKSKYDYTYRVTPGDILELTMPTTLEELSWESAKNHVKDGPYYCRVSEDGTITLPVVGRITVAGMTTGEVEAAIVQAHYPKYVTRPPAVVCNISEHRDERTFAVMGLVRKPDSFKYPPNAHFTLADALAMAGGTDVIANPKYATIYRQDEQGEVVAATFKIDRSHFTEASKVLIEPGDIVSVDRSFGTEMNMALNRVINFGFGVGASVTP